MEAIKLIEERITSMELQVFGKRNPHNFEFNTGTSVTQSLHDINVLILSALAGRETTTRTLTRLPELNECMDPHYEDSFLDTDAKLEYILAMEPVIRAIGNQLTAMAKYEKVLDDPVLTSAPDNTNQLDQVAIKYLSLKIDCDKVSSDIILAMRKYNEIVKMISLNFSQLERTVTDLEIQAQPKKALE